jgi:hypothetical protein
LTTVDSVTGYPLDVWADDKMIITADYNAGIRTLTADSTGNLSYLDTEDPGFPAYSYGCFGWRAGATIPSTAKYGICVTDLSDAPLGLTVNANISATETVYARNLRVTNPTVPDTATAPGAPGDFAWDIDYTYVCVANNTWKRSLLSGGW